ncbi:27142_t:CDS:1, partial [Gigaspora margarita]
GPLRIDPKTQIIVFPYKSQDQPKISIIVKDETQKNWLNKFLIDRVKYSLINEVENKISENLKRKIPEIKMNLNHINVFAASNILFPGRQII